GVVGATVGTTVWLPPGMVQFTTWAAERSAAGVVRATVSLPPSAVQMLPWASTALWRGAEKEGARPTASCWTLRRSITELAWSPESASPTCRAKAPLGTLKVKVWLAPGAMTAEEAATEATLNVPQAKAPAVGWRLVRPCTEKLCGNLSALATDTCRGAPGARN